MSAPDFVNIISPPEWMTDGLCAQTDPDAFFPEKGGSTREAKRICTGCEVRAECLEYALANDARFGVWGGASERDRRRMKQPAVRQPVLDSRTNEVRRLATRLNDSEIAGRLGCSSRTVLRIRMAGGIAPALPRRGGATQAGAA